MVPRLDDRCPPVCDTLCSTKSRSSVASCFNSARPSLRTSAGDWMVLSRACFMVVALGLRCGASAVPLDDAVGQQAQPRGVGEAAAGQRGLGLVAQLVGVAAGGVEAEHR